MNTTTTTQKTSERPSSFKARQKKLAISGPRPLTRKEARAIARHNMKTEGITHINHKRGEKKESFFAQHWREYIPTKPTVRTARQRGHISGSKSLSR